MRNVLRPTRQASNQRNAGCRGRGRELMVEGALNGLVAAPIHRSVDNSSDLRALLSSRHSLVVVEMRDERRFLGLLRDIASALQVSMWTWTATRGLAREGNDPQYGTSEARAALDFIPGVAMPSIFVLVDVHHALSDPLVVRRVKELAMSLPSTQTLVLAGPQITIPPELHGLALRWTLQPPSRQELEDLVARTIRDLRERRRDVHIDEAAVPRLVDALRGLSVTEAESIVQRAVLRDGRIDSSDVGFVLGEKAGLLESSGTLELIEADDGTLDDVGGMNRLKDWLRLRGRAMEAKAREFGLDPPRGVLITGVPGCGKSLVAKTLARTWNLPLVLLDPARLYGRFIGESEERLADALRTVEAMAPVVLWIDEIEKGFAASSGGDGGVSQRMRGTFLRWMQDRPPGTFVVATCNDVTALPPELSRKGRFDEVFFVDLPEAAERETILRLHLTRRGRDPNGFALDKLVAASDGFSGAEIEAAVVGALYAAFARDEELTTQGIFDELTGTVPLSRSRAEEVEALRSWARTRAVSAS